MEEKKNTAIGFGIVFVVVFTLMIILNPVFAQSNIPTWVKNNAGWWADDLISDNDFTSGIKFLMGEGLLSTNTIPDEFPSYLKTDSKNWSDGVITDSEYLLILENWIEGDNQESVNETVSSLIPSSSSVESFEIPQNQIGNDSNFETGLKVGQWVKYSSSISSGGYGDMEKFVGSLERELKDQSYEENGYSIDNTIWIKYTVADVSGTVVTFDRTVMLASDSETRDEYILQSLLETLSPEDKIDPDVLSNIYEMKLESRQFDLAEFNPETFFAMPTNLEFGSKFDGSPASGEVTFAAIDDLFRTGAKSNVFTAHKITAQTVRAGVVEITMEFDTIANFYYDRQSGILESRSVDIEITNRNTFDNGWITLTVSAIDRSDEPKSNTVSKPINDRDEILERLSYFFVESADSGYLFTDGVESIGEPKRTTFDIIRPSDGYELGSLILYGDDKISLIRSSTLVGGGVKLFDADRIHGLIVLSLEPNCEIFVPDHADLLLENTDEGTAFVETICNDISVSRSWTETNAGLKMGVFVQEITFLEEDTSKQNTIKQNEIGQDDVPRNLEEFAKSVEQNSESSDLTQESSKEINYGSAALGAFIFLGIPVIIIGLIIWKIKQRRSRRK